MEMKSITRIYNNILEMEQNIDELSTKITPTIIDKELRQLLPLRLKEKGEEM